MLRFRDTGCESCKNKCFYPNFPNTADISMNFSTLYFTIKLHVL